MVTTQGITESEKLRTTISGWLVKCVNPYTMRYYPIFHFCYGNYRCGIGVNTLDWQSRGCGFNSYCCHWWPFQSFNFSNFLANNPTKISILNVYAHFKWLLSILLSFNLTPFWGQQVHFYVYMICLIINYHDYTNQKQITVFRIAKIFLKIKKASQTMKVITLALIIIIQDQPTMCRISICIWSSLC